MGGNRLCAMTFSPNSSVAVPNFIAEQACAKMFLGAVAQVYIAHNPEHALMPGLVWTRLDHLGLRSTLKPQCGKVCFIVKSGIGLGDLCLRLL